MKYQHRDSNGRFASLKKLAQYVYTFGVIGFICFAVLFSFTSKTIAIPEARADIETVVSNLSGKKLEKKIAELRMEIVERLATCESGNKEDSDNLVTYDPSESGKGEVPSFGRLQYKRQTFQMYQDIKTGEKISLREAMIRATDRNLAFEMADYILFNTEKSWKEWKKCGQTLGLEPEIRFIKKLSN